MSAYRDNSGYSKLSPVAPVAKGLAASRWAPGAVDNQQMKVQQMNKVKKPNNKAANPTTNSLTTSRWAPRTIDQRMANQQMTDLKLPTVKATKQATNGLVNSRWATNAPEAPQTGGNNNVREFQQKKANSMPNQPTFRASNGVKTTPVTSKTHTTTRRIIGDLSEEEKTVSMENPFFDPEKHKGLASSRWAD